jgi:hypothetical protein
MEKSATDPGNVQVIQVYGPKPRTLTDYFNSNPFRHRKLQPRG